jgi:tetratricopeptide (TPR) repeat protein
MRLVFVLLASLMVGPWVPQANAQQNAVADPRARVALVIGNASYQDADAPLKDPVGDARALASALQRAGFDVDVAENLTKDAMRGTLDRFYGKIKPGTVTLIFFSGFGIQSNRQNYLIPVDAHIWTENDVRREGMSLDAILSELGNRQPSAAIAVLEAARRNPFERRYRLTAAGLAPITATPGTLVAHATAPNALIDDTNRGLFVSELVKQIGSADLPIQDVFSRTSLAVSQASQGEQVPWFSSGLGDKMSLSQTSPALTDDKHASTAGSQAPDVSAQAAATPESKVATVEPAQSEKQQTTVQTPEAKAPATTDKATPAESTKPKAAEQSTPSQNAPSSPANGPDAKTPSPATAADPGNSSNASTAVVAHVDPAAGRISSAAMNPTDDAAIKALDAKLQQNPNDANAFYRRGQLYAKNGVFPRAADDFDAAIRLNPKDPDAYNNRCWVRAMAADLKTALQDCDEALRLRPGFADALDSRGLVHLKLSMAASAIADYDAALKIKPNQASSLYGRGIGKLRIGKAADGNADIAAAKAINSGIADEFASYGIR